MSTTGTPRHFLSIDDFSYAELRGMLDQAGALKARLKDGDRPQLLKDKVLAMIFERQSTRTRVSFDVGMRQLGGETIMLSGQEMQLAREETLSDHDPHPQPCRSARTGRGRDRARDQRPDAPRASVPDHG